MRLRHVKEGHKILDEHPRVVTKPENMEGGLDKIFDNENELHIELGSGKGGFIRKLALMNPDINYLGFEMSTKVIFRWLNTIETEGVLPNYYIVHSKAEIAREIFSDNSVDRIYLNFSDPWPKPRHEKRRLTSPNHLDIYRRILKNEGELVFKTDNVDLFDYSLEVMAENGWDVVFQTHDLYGTDHVDDNVATEYEEKFVGEGKKICKLIARASLK
ncbi:tRNA (guanine-N7-)-methyltransferase [Dethiosulfatibacter aminovorans DSM 17477]|uniref:tRNA (guanine-N(7)-)-methyltransferase n=1 Tax=Dethiosulfatibacter aminovorans DSM 17477 TaxID=1121476 RepID=A0A1M6GS10_9FIRM|nr:tRNA (guanosine(46)-N7)-methyltransferase TrmB [Dethiosulfatibacter aminovorans]SHJ12730.1 tRNA (guanine-N7-)-methyltransferase [Dethiosulfatibacter aminovorans DSM 17477]